MPLICIGNISVGGTGKSPMAEYLIRMLLPKYKMATVSRGYKRKTKGYVLANEQTTALEIGDEPMQFYLKYPQVAVAVGEQRLEAIPQLLQDRPETQVILLDDAFQHRQIQAGLNIVLTAYHQPYWTDWFLPTGDLRDQRKSVRRAQMIVVTKCPENLAEAERQKCLQAINPLPHQLVFFTTLHYGVPYRMFTGQPLPLHPGMEVLLVCGIANPAPLKKYLEAHTAAYFEMRYTDHHIFTIDDWKEIQKRFAAMEAPHKILLTTEKDAVRLIKFGSQVEDSPMYVLPVEHKFLFGQEAAFHQQIHHYIAQYYPNPV